MHLLLALVLFVQTAPDALLGRLAGQWAGTGTVLNQPAKIEMAWTWELGGRFLKLTFRNEMGTAPKLSVFEGHAYYRATADGRYRGMWFDNSGMFRPLDANREGDALVSKWGTPDTEEGETTYRLLPNGSMEVIDRVKGKDGTWRTFGQSGLMKR
ncbi:MAG TPA: hypothetical protein VNT81_05795 [Vicinamibacterales bacterium]|nr:hypothetical protein [Vicinamibacterales bacterium]